MGAYADLANKLFDVIENERAAGSLTYFKKVFFGERDRPADLAGPWAWIKMDPAEPINEEWVAAKDRRDGILTMRVDLCIQIKNDARPYGVTGDAAQRGILVMVSDLLNRLDARRADFVAPTIPSCYDMNLGVREVGNIGGETMAASVVVKFKTRFNAAGR